MINLRSYTISGTGATVQCTAKISGPIVQLSATGKHTNGTLWVVSMPVDTWNALMREAAKAHRKMRRKRVRCRTCGRRFSWYPKKNNACPQCGNPYIPTGEGR